MSNQYEGSAGWVRVLFVALFWFVFYLTQFVIAAVIIAQCVFTLINGTPNQQLLSFGDSLSYYVKQIIGYATFNTDQRPFPFNEFPKSDIVLTSKS